MAYILGRRGGSGGGGGGGAPSGPAGGDLGGTYPNPTVPNLIPKTLLDAKGDLIAASAADTAAKVTVGANGTVLTAASGQSAGLLWSVPPGAELDYAQVTANASITATSAATATTLITGASVAYNGSTVIIVDAYAPGLATNVASSTVLLNLWEDSTDLGVIGHVVTGSNTTVCFSASVRRTPSNASHTYSLRGWRTTNDGTLLCVAGTYVPAFIRITKAA